MDNHYHLVLENSSGRMSDFFRNLNTHYAFYYRKAMGGKGYVFQSRFHSTIIQDDSYLKQALIYTLQNPLRVGLAEHYKRYKWSSGKWYGHKKQPDWLAGEYVVELFAGHLDNAVQAELIKKLPLLKSPFGPLLGDQKFIEKALEQYERRDQPSVLKKRRHDAFSFDPAEKVIQEFEKQYTISVDDIDCTHWQGKRLRGELLIRLRDLSGLTYHQIAAMPVFAGLQYKSLAPLYRHVKARLEES